jgi:biopolymer transport protein ExbB
LSFAAFLGKVTNSQAKGVPNTVWSIISAAGWPIWPLIFASVVALAIVFERLWALRHQHVLPEDLVGDVCKNLPQFKDPQNISRLQQHSALGSVLAAGLNAHHQGKPVAQSMADCGQQVSKQLEKHLDILSLIATIAPLMGLLGTVIGMIDIFAVQGAANQSPESMAAGIAVALYNTAFGLIVAIPAMVAFRLFRVRINKLLDNLEIMVQPLEQLLEADLTPAVATKRVASTVAA